MILLTLLLVIGAAVVAAIATRRPGESASVRLFGGLLLAVGLLIALASGICTAGWLTMMLHQPRPAPGSTYDNGRAALGFAAVFGGVPFVIGAAMFFAGVVILRRPKPPID